MTRGESKGAANLANRWAARREHAAGLVEVIFACTGLTMEAVTAQTLAAKLDDFERIERLIA
jgi:hypothetical protein